MKVILCTGGKKDLGKIMGKLIGDQLPKIQTDTIDSIQGISRTLCRPMNRISVIIIFVVCDKDIQRLFSLAPLFDNIRLILVLPRAATGLVSQGMQLNPSFISYLDSDFTDVLSVLKKKYITGFGSHGHGRQMGNRDGVLNCSSLKTTEI